MLFQDANEDEVQRFCRSLADKINWFFFDYFLLGYVEDYNTGLSLRFPNDVSRSVYVEVNIKNRMCISRMVPLLLLTLINQNLIAIPLHSA